MDLDAYIAAHQGEWRRLQALVRTRRPNGAQADELLDLYQRVATQLSQIRSAAPDPEVVQMLSTLLASARTKASGARTASWDGVGRFFAGQLPAALYRTARWWVPTMLVNLAVMVLIGSWVSARPGVQSRFVPPEQMDQLVHHEFAGYYSQYAAQDFAARVWTNNAWIAALCIAAGVLAVPVLAVLWVNVVNVGVTGGIMVGHGRAAEFFGLILPHGMLELTAVFVAAGVGLSLCWAWISPGEASRSASLAAHVRSAMVVVLGLALVLLVSGVIEAFVTPSGLPTWARIGIGGLAELGFLGYVFVIGRDAARAGETGDLGELDRSAVDPVAG